MAEFTGTSGADTVRPGFVSPGVSVSPRGSGVDGDDNIFVGGGNDFVDAGRGFDFIVGGTGNDSLGGGSGDDYIAAGGGADFIRAGIGDDRIEGMGGNDDIFGGAGVDILFGGGGADDFLFGTTHSGDLDAFRADFIDDFNEAEGDRILLEGSYAFAGATDTPADGEYGVWLTGGVFGNHWIVTWNAPGDAGFHDVRVFGDDPTGDVFFYTSTPGNGALGAAIA